MIVDGAKSRITMAKGILERLVQHRSANIEKGLHGGPVPAHLLFLVHSLGHDLVDRALNECRRDRLTTPAPGSIMHQHVLVAPEVTKKFADVSLKTVDAGYLAHVLALRPAVQASKFTPAPYPAAVPQAPFRPLEMTNDLFGKMGVSCAETARCLQSVLKTNGDVPPVQHDRRRWQRLALQPPQPGVPIAQYRRWRVGVHPGRGERLCERARRSCLAVARKGETVLPASGIDHFARNHLEMAFLLAVPTAHVATIKSNSHGANWPRHRLSGVLAENLLTHPLPSVADRARILRPADRQQLGQQNRDLAERCQCRISGREVSQFGCHRITAEIQHAETLHLARSLTGTDKQPPRANRHIAEQRAEG